MILVLPLAAAGSGAGAHDGDPTMSDPGLARSVLPARIASADTVARGDAAGDGEEGRDSGVHPARTRMLFTPAAWPLGAGDGYVALYELFFPFVGVGVTDFVSIAGGVSLIPGADRQFFMFAPKISPIATDRFAAAAGVTWIGELDGDGIGIVYADLSVGSREASGTFGLGWGLVGEDLSDRPVVIAGFQLPLGGGVDIVSENWFPPNLDPAILSLGVRTSAHPMSADLAVLCPAGREGGGWNVIPWVSFTYEF